jgi:signal transduction histidine kinase
VQDAQDLWDERARLRPRQLLFDVLTAGVFTLLAVLAALTQPPLLMAGTIAMGLALAVRRVSWPAMAALALAAGVSQLVGGELVIVADAGYAPVFFVLGAHPSAWVRRLGLAGAAGSAVVLATAVGTGAVGDAATGGSTAFAVVGSAALATMVAGGGWALGYARWQNRARIKAQVQAGLEQERTRIAADMHDLVAHTWAVVAAQADGARYALEGSEGAERSEGDRRAAEALEVIAETARASIADLRGLLAELRYDEPVTPPGRAGHDALLERMRASGMRLTASSHGEPSGSGLVAVTAQKLLSESLTNALKHGDLTHPVELEEDWRDGYRLVVRNRVPHLPAGVPPPLSTGHGVAGMRERVELAGGRFAVVAEGDIWTITAELPERVG